MKPLVNNEWVSWLSYEKDEKGNAKLKSDTPQYIVEKYEKYKKDRERKITSYWE